MANARHPISHALHATTVEELRSEGIYQILSSEECVEQAHALGDAAMLTLHPLCGGMPIDKGWESLHLLTEQVLPKLA